MESLDCFRTPAQKNDKGMYPDECLRVCHLLHARDFDSIRPTRKNSRKQDQATRNAEQKREHLDGQ